MEIKDIFDMGVVNLRQWKGKVSTVTNSPDVIEQLLSLQQLMLLAGQFQIGKTNELLHLYFSFMHEDCKWHGLKVSPSHVLYLTWEGNPKKISERLTKIEFVYQDKNEICEGYFKMMNHKLCLNTAAGREKYKKLIEPLNPRPTVVLLDPFKRTVDGNYSLPPVAETWIESVSLLARETGTTIIASCHTNKLIYKRGETEDTLSADKVKGAGDLLDGVNCSVLFGEEKGNKRVKIGVSGEVFEKVKWIVFNRVIKIIKAKDALVELPMLKVNLNREKLIHTGQEWVVNPDGTITIEDEI